VTTGWTFSQVESQAFLSQGAILMDSSDSEDRGDLIKDDTGKSINFQEE
jgi:hypothetical protein